MDDLQFIAHLENLENADVQINRHNRFENIDPFETLSEHQFLQLFRLTKRLCRYLIETLTPFLRPQRRPTDLSVTTKVLVACRFFASGSYQMDIGRNIFVSVSQPSVSRCIEEVTNALNEPEVFNRWVHFPRNFQELNAVRLGFYEDYNFPGVVGCVDCTHVAIFPPKIEDEDYPEHIYVNRKGYHSINVQLICDSRLRIINVNARYPGSTHDAYIWGNSNILNFFTNLHAQGHTNYYLLGDTGYPLRTWLLTPLEGELPENSPEWNYNAAQKRTRCLIERCNGVLKMRFRCLLKHRVLHYRPSVACRIINSCVVLHNMCIEYNTPMPENEDRGENHDFGIILNRNGPEENIEEHAAVGRVNPQLAAGRRARTQLINNYFRNNH